MKQIGIYIISHSYQFPPPVARSATANSFSKSPKYNKLLLTVVFVLQLDLLDLLTYSWYISATFPIPLKPCNHYIILYLYVFGLSVPDIKGVSFGPNTQLTYRNNEKLI